MPISKPTPPPPDINRVCRTRRTILPKIPPVKRQGMGTHGRAVTERPFSFWLLERRARKEKDGVAGQAKTGPGFAERSGRCRLKQSDAPTLTKPVPTKPQATIFTYTDAQTQVQDTDRAQSPGPDPSEATKPLQSVYSPPPQFQIRGQIIKCEVHSKHPITPPGPCLLLDAQPQEQKRNARHHAIHVVLVR